jgi:hypothetical protein
MFLPSSISLKEAAPSSSQHREVTHVTYNANIVNMMSLLYLPIRFSSELWKCLRLTPQMPNIENVDLWDNYHWTLSVVLFLIRSRTFRRLDSVSVFGWNILRWVQQKELVSVSGPGSIHVATRFSEKQWVWKGVHSASRVQFRSYLEEKVAAPV